MNGVCLFVRASSQREFSFISNSSVFCCFVLSIALNQQKLIGINFGCDEYDEGVCRLPNKLNSDFDFVSLQP